MANVATDDIFAAVEQTKQVVANGAEYFRFTAQGVKQAKALGEIKQQLLANGIDIPLIADIHFNPQAAFEALNYVEKVRINPGNFAEQRSSHTHITEIGNPITPKHVEEVFSMFVQKAQKLNRAIRIGTNHGSLSQRMLTHWGDTPQGMVESAIEYAKLCEKLNFSDVVISMKSSNVLVMTESVRLLVKRLDTEGIPFPLHLGVTEAGESEDGRIKSAIGIGSLLADGIGDTIRVSLSEPPEAEIPVAEAILKHIALRSQAPTIEAYCKANSYKRGFYPRSLAKKRNNFHQPGIAYPIIVRGRENLPLPNCESNNDLITTSSQPLCPAITHKYGNAIEPFFFDSSELSACKLEAIAQNPKAVIFLSAPSFNRIGYWRNAFELLANLHITTPVILHLKSNEQAYDQLLIEASIDLGTLLLDGVANGICIDAPKQNCNKLYTLALGIMQATRLRFSHAEFISCPSCGRTLFDLQGTVAEVKKHLGHLKNLKIGVMGCIVNGPGEMADADYGYVGSSPGKIDLYKGKTVMKRGIAQSDAVKELVELIKEGGDWYEP